MWKFLSNNFTAIAVTTIGAFFGFLFALCIEWIRLMLDKKKTQKLIENENKRKIEYFILLLEEVVRVSEQQANIIRNYIMEQRRNFLSIKTLTLIATNVFTRLKNIDNRGVFEALAARFKNDKTWLSRYNKLNSSLDFLEGLLREELHRINNNTLEKGYKDLCYIRDLIEYIANVLSKEAMRKANELGDGRFEDSEYQFIDAKIKLYRQLIEEQSNLNKIGTHFLLPMQKEILEEYLEFKEYPYIQDILFKSKDARVRMNNVRQDIQNVLNTYQRYVQQMQQSIEYIEQMIIQLNNKQYGKTYL
ncbi:MAG: hypothetical protein LBR66_00215 [Candidatus Symbiothrix sp.]|jgi:hypothetical protein|nr:hypothetical protein [Candidatus Symbiothrix sp.]